MALLFCSTCSGYSVGSLVGSSLLSANLGLLTRGRNSLPLLVVKFSVSVGGWPGPFNM